MIKGIVTIQKRNKDTLELIEEQEVKNIITQRGYEFIYGSSISTRNRIFITEQVVTNDLKVVSYAGLTGNGEFFTDVTAGTVLAGFPLWTAGTPNKIEMSERFQPPATVTRNVNSIYLGDNDDCLGYVGLLTPCTQTTSEILDVVYRLEFSSDLTNNTPNKYTNFDLSTLEAEGSFSAPAIEKGRIDNFNRLWINPNTIGSKYNYFMFGEGTTSVPDTYTTITSDYLLDYSNTATFTYSETQHIGQLFGSFLGYSNSLNATNRWYSYFVEKSITPTFASAPIQPIHNHNAAAISPFLDVNFLASGTGTVNMDGTSWTNPDMPKLYRTEIVTSGAVGVSEYYMKKRNHLGFTGSNYDDREEFLPWISKGDTNKIGEKSTIPNIHWADSTVLADTNSIHCEEYNDTKIMSWDSTGVTIVDVITGEYAILDNSTLSIAFTSIYQCDADTSGNVWIADSSLGLYKIVSPFSSPTSTLFTVAIHSIPADGACYGVTVGNNAVFAMFNGGLSKTTDGGTSWTNHDTLSTPKFEYVGITDSNWSNVRLLRADRSDTTNDIVGIITVMAGTDDAELVFWKSSADYTLLIDTLLNSLDSVDGSPASTKFRCSRKGSKWVYITNVGGSSRQLYEIDPKTMFRHSLFLETSTVQVQYLEKGITFTYDNLDMPYIIIRPFGSATESQLHGFEGNTYELLKDARLSIYQSAFMFENSELNGLGIYFDLFAKTSTSFLTTDTTTTPLIGGRLEHVIWKNLGWNGSAWVEGFNATLTDASTNSNAGIRKGFTPGTIDFDRFQYITNTSINTDFIVSDSALTLATNVNSEYTANNDVSNNIVFSIDNNGKYLSLVNRKNTNTTKLDDELSMQFGTWTSKLGTALTTSVNDRYAITFDRLAISASTYTSASIVPSTLSSDSWFVNTGSLTINDGASSFTMHDEYFRNQFTEEERNGVNVFTGEIPHLASNDFKVLFNRNQTDNSWHGNVPTSDANGRFVLRIDFDKESIAIPGSVVKPKFEDRYLMHQTTKFMEISLRHTFNVTPTLVTPTVYGVDGNRVYNDFTLVNATVADDFNGTNELAVKFAHNGTSYDITITSDDGVSETTLYTITAPIDIPATQTGRVMWHLTTGGNRGSSTATQYLATEEISNFKVVRLDDAGLVNQNAITEVAAYKNGVLLDTVFTEDIDYANVDEIRFGNNIQAQYKDHRYGYEGTLDNIQVWNGKWNGADIAADAAAPTAVIVPAGGATLELRYTNLVADVSSEIKTTHAGSVAVEDGLTNSFTVGASGTDFVATDYYTNGVYDGVWKDDAIAFSGHFNYYYKPITYGFTDVESHTAPNITPVVIPSTTTNVTEKVFFTRIGSEIITVPGELSSRNADNFGVEDSCTGFQELTGNGYLEFTLRSIPFNSPSRGTWLGLSDNVPGSHVNMDYGIFISQNIIRVYENGTNIGTFGVNYARDDVYRITRTGTTIEYRQNTNLIYTSLIPSSTNLWFFMTGDGSVREVFSDVVMNYDKPANMIDIGNSVTLTGKYDADFLLCLEEENLYTITINAVPATVITVEETANFTEMTSPGVNEVVINRLAGVAKFNPADVGKTITISAPIMKYQ